MSFMQGGVNYFTTGSNPTRNGCGDSDPVDADTGADIAQLVPAGMYGWIGYGGCLHLWDPETGVGFAYVPTHLAWYDRGWQRALTCLKALYRCLADK